MDKKYYLITFNDDTQIAIDIHPSDYFQPEKCEPYDFREISEERYKSFNQ